MLKQIINCQCNCYLNWNGIFLLEKNQLVPCNLNLVTTCDLVTNFQFITFNLVTLCDLVTVFAETKSITKSRLHCTFVISSFISILMSKYSKIPLNQRRSQDRCPHQKVIPVAQHTIKSQFSKNFVYLWAWIEGGDAVVRRE